MNIAFHGAAREVTGSCHLLEVGETRILLDCGMIQGGKERHERNREPFPFKPSEIDLVVLSHAHIDHSGRLPLLIREGYQGPILATDATVALLKILLEDSGRIQEEDARWKIKRLRKQKKAFKWVKPLYTEEDARAVPERLVKLAFDTPHPIGDVGTVRMVMAGHILGAAVVELDLEDGSGSHRVTFSGDLGVKKSRLLESPHHVQCPDTLLMESTYGNRSREDEGDRTEALFRIIERTAERGGKVVIPSFAVGRTQELLARINDLVEAGRLSGIPVYVDSPMAIEATRVFATHPEAYSEEARRLLRCGDEPLDFPGLTLSRSVEDSIAINEMKGPAVVISASGMATAGRIKHHLKHNISDERASVVFVGYQAQGTLGRLIQSGVDPIRIFGKWYPVRASIETIEGFSAHADRDELVEWFESLCGVPRRTFLVHGEEESAMSLARNLKDRFGATVEVPRLGDRFPLRESK